MPQPGRIEAVRLNQRMDVHAYTHALQRPRAVRFHRSWFKLAAHKGCACMLYLALQMPLEACLTLYRTNFRRLDGEHIEQAASCTRERRRKGGRMSVESRRAVLTGLGVGGIPEVTVRGVAGHGEVAGKNTNRHQSQRAHEGPLRKRWGAVVSSSRTMNAPSFPLR